MKRPHQIVLTLIALVGFALPGRAVVLVDDTWADGTRTNQNLPTDSAWFTSRPTLVSVGTGFLSITNDLGNQSSEWTTYFTQPGNVSRLGVGDTITFTWEFIPRGVPTATNSSQTFRIALCDSSAGARISSDSTVSAVNYVGYAFFCRFSPVWGSGTGLELRRRNVLGNANLLATSGDWATLGSSGGTVSGTPGFSNDVPYTLTISLTRTNETTLSLTASFSGGGLTNSITREDTGATTAGTISTNFNFVMIRPQNASQTATNFVFTRFKVEGTAAVPGPPAIVTQPQDQTLTVAEPAIFTVGAGGAVPLSYQWYFNNTGTPLANATNTTLLLTNVQTGQAGGYFAIVTNSQGAATSQVANLTVNLPVFTGLGVVVDDVWADSDRISGPVGISNSVWYASAASSLTASAGSMLGTPDAGTSRLWVGYFTDDPSAPVDLAVGRSIKATLVFTPTNVAPKNTSSLRFGLFTYATGATRLSGDDFGSGSTGNGVNVRGYMLQQNFGTEFGDDTPMEIHARNVMASADLMGSTGAYLSLASGPAGSSNAPAFSSGTQYTLALTVARTDQAAVHITTRITGGSLDISQSVTDSTYAYRRFDAFAIRANRTTDSAEQLNITRFLVEVSEAAVPFQITSIERLSASSVKLTWQSISNKVYQVRSRDSLSSGGWITNGTVTATGPSASFTNTGLSGIPQRYYQVVQTP